MKIFKQYTYKAEAWKDKLQRMVKILRKNYIYAMTLVILSLTVWLSYYFYLELRPQEYKNGMFVEVPREATEDIWELDA